MLPASDVDHFRYVRAIAPAGSVVITMRLTGLTMESKERRKAKANDSDFRSQLALPQQETLRNRPDPTPLSLVIGHPLTLGHRPCSHAALHHPLHRQVMKHHLQDGLV